MKSSWFDLPLLPSMKFFTDHKHRSPKHNQKKMKPFWFFPQDEISRIRKRKRGRNMWNHCGNTPLSVWWRLLVFPLLWSQRNRNHFFTCFRQVSVGGNKHFRKCNFMLTCAETHCKVAETLIFYISVDVIRPKRSRKCKVTFRKHVFLLFPLT